MPESMDALRAILLRGREMRDLDYKGPCAWQESDRRACCKLVKDILAMANTQGGYIVIGVEETAKGFSYKTGLTEDQLRTWETTRLNNFANNYADPPINTRLVKVEHEGSCFVMIEVPPFSESPHICQKDFPDVLEAPIIYVRTANNESAPIKSVSDMSSLIERTVRVRSDRMLQAMRTILVGASTTPGPTDMEQFERQLETAEHKAQKSYPPSLAAKKYTLFYDAAMFPSRFQERRFPLRTVREALERESQVDFRGWPFVFMDTNRTANTYNIADGVETSIDHEFFGGDGWDFWQARTSGLCFQRVLGLEDGHAERFGWQANSLASISEIVSYSAEAVDWLVRYYTALGITDESVTLRLRLLGTSNRQLVVTNRGRWPLRGNHSSHEPQIGWDRQLPLEEWRSGLVDLATEAAFEIMLRFNWTPTVDQISKDVRAFYGRQL